MTQGPDLNTTPPAPLRVGLLLNSLLVPGWARLAVQQIRASGFAEVVLLVVRDDPEQDATPPADWSTRWRNRDLWLHALYERLDRWRHPIPDDPSELRDASDLLSDVPVLRVTPRTTKFCDYFDDAAVAAIREHDLDVAIRFGFRILKGEALRVARCGVWSFHHGSDATHRGGPAGAWEVIERSPVTGFVLQVLSEELDNGRVLARSYTSTEPNSPRANRANLHRASPSVLLRQLRRLYEEGFDRLGEEERPQGWTGYARRLYTLPRTRDMLPFLGRVGLRAVTGRWRARRDLEQWILAYHFHEPDPAGDNAPHQTLYRLKPLVPPKDRFWADPFPVQHDGRHFVLFEEAPFATGRGYISLLELDRQGVRGEPVRVLERPYHLSYPFVFEWNGAHYMVPETADNGTIELYRATRFPYEWELDRVLLSGVVAVDTTLLAHGGRWWLFTNLMQPNGSPNDELHLFHAPSPLGPWVPHRRSPIVTDVRRARPAGRIFEWQGALHRPAQDCSERYGGAIVVHRIDQLDECAYRESVVSYLAPRWAPNLLGMHTINAAGGLTVVDALLRRPRRG